MSKVVIEGYNIDHVTTSMRRMLAEASHDTDLRDLAVSVVHGSPSSDIYDWMKANVRYIPDPVDIEMFQHPSRMVRDFRVDKSLSGDCDDIALLTAAMLQAVGVKSRVVLIDTACNGLDHAVAQVWSDKLQDWLTVDASTDRVPFGWQEKYSSILAV